MSWQAVTDRWVSEGLIEAEQQPALQEWLETQPLPKPPSPFADAVIATLVMVASWLLTGAVLLAMNLLDAPEWSLEWTTLTAGLVQLVVGLPARWVAGRPLAQGLWSASVLVITIALIAILEPPWTGAELVFLPLALAPAALATAVALVDRQPGLAGAAGLAASLPLLLELGELNTGYPEALAAACLVATGLACGLSRIAPERIEPLMVQIPFATFVAISCLIGRSSWMGSGAWAWESGVLQGGYGLLVLVAAAVAGSRWALVSAVGALMASEITLLAAVGSLVVSILVLGAEGAALMGSAVLFLVVRARREAPA